MNHYDVNNGWEHTKPGWYEVVIPVYVFWDARIKHLDILKWIYSNIGKCEHHCRWQFYSDSLKYKFRYERDYVWFKLTWG